MTTRNFGLVTALVVAFALLLRISCHLGTEPLVHIAGDINDYVRYAWNLDQHGVYSFAPISREAAPLPASFRPPGYPLLLLLAMQLDGFGPERTKIAYPLQILLINATALLTIVLGRKWMRPGFVMAAGALVALWPHHIVFASMLFSKTLLGFCIVLALWLTAMESTAIERHPILRNAHTALKRLNPAHFASAVAGTVLLLTSGCPGTSRTSHRQPSK